MPRGDTGLVRIDAEHDFLRQRRHQRLSALTARLRGGDTSGQALSFDAVVEALGVQGERNLGTRVIPIDAIIGSVDKTREFDHRFRPTSGRSRERWERISRLSRTGGSLPPIDVYKVGDRYFVRDGHHRVSVARSLGSHTIEANVTEVITVLTPEGIDARLDLQLKRWRRLFLQRVPLGRSVRGGVTVRDAADYGTLAEMVEAWGARLMHAEARYLDRAEIARRWYAEEYQPVTRMIEDAELGLRDETGAEAYMRVAGERYRLILAHEWSDDVLSQMKGRGARRTRGRSRPGSRPGV